MIANFSYAHKGSITILRAAHSCYYLFIFTKYLALHKMWFLSISAIVCLFLQLKIRHLTKINKGYHNSVVLITAINPLWTYKICLKMLNLENNHKEQGN